MGLAAVEGSSCRWNYSGNNSSGGTSSNFHGGHNDVSASDCSKLAITLMLAIVAADVVMKVQCRGGCNSNDYED